MFCNYTRIIFERNLLFLRFLLLAKRLESDFVVCRILLDKKINFKKL